MPLPPFPRNLREFQHQFASEEACQQYLATCCPMASRVGAAGTSAYAHDETTTLAVRRLPVSSVSDVRDDFAQHQNPIEVVVLGRVPDDDRQTWDLRNAPVRSNGKSSEEVLHSIISNRV